MCEGIALRCLLPTLRLPRFLSGTITSKQNRILKWCSAQSPGDVSRRTRFLLMINLTLICSADTEFTLSFFLSVFFLFSFFQKLPFTLPNSKSHRPQMLSAPLFYVSLLRDVNGRCSKESLIVQCQGFPSVYWYQIFTRSI